MADVDAALEGEILDIAERQREADLQHRHELDHLGRAVEPAERISGLGFASHSPELKARPYQQVHLAWQCRCRVSIAFICIAIPRRR